MDGQQEAYRWAWKYLQPELREQLERLRETGSANSASPESAFLSWFNNNALDKVPAEQVKGLLNLIESVTYKVIARQSPLAAARLKPYKPLEQGGRIVPKGGVTIDTKTQPRMPWHDVHCVISGPSVYDLSMNFVRRWSAVAHRYDMMATSTPSNKEESAILSVLGLQDELELDQVKELEQKLKQKVEQWKKLKQELNQKLAQKLDQVQEMEQVQALAQKLEQVRVQARELELRLGSAPKSAPETSFQAPRIADDCLPKRAEKQGSCRVQVLRSAPKQLLEDEAAAGFGERPVGAEDNCLYAMLRAIRGACHFIYIENQFFQSWYGKEDDTRGKLSGPMAALLDITASPGYHKFAPILEIENIPLAEIPEKMRWAKVDDVQRAPGGPAFLADLLAALGNQASVKITQNLGPPQLGMQNQTAQALVTRIEQAIKDGKPFHVYLVVPVHPEGTLNTLNIMSQVHLTMQSLVFGHQSLVNGVRRAILAKRQCKAQGLGRKEQGREWQRVMEGVAQMALNDIADEVGDEWKEYLTLLNLRNWENIGGRPVTEQIYVHSKLLIADDRVAILGSANINDRSQLGGRDSELAVVVTDEAAKQVSLDGEKAVPVSACVHELRVNLWSKLFGLAGGRSPADELKGVLDKPAAAETWKQIQTVAMNNARLYAASFAFTPRNDPDPTVQQKDPTIVDPKTQDELKLGASLWPAWRYNNYGDHELGGKLAYRMPFELEFWQPPASGKVEPAHTYYARTNAPVSEPQGVRGYIVELPAQWTLGENNYSGMHLALLAKLMEFAPGQQKLYARADEAEPRSVSS
jgi:phosphatidylserine/phosphatidylglycerophosphate/cardiolipin synthase-like enzyme